jgi:uncharacterized protein YcnI
MKALLPTLALLVFASAARAHVTLDQPEAPARSSYRAVFKVSHGCDGAATTEIAVTLPEGLRGAKPMPKPGWTLTTQRRPLKTPYDSHGKAVTDELAEARWVANSAADQLPDAWYDEFVLRASLPAEPGELAFQVRQVCTRGEWHWAELPSAANPKPRAPAVRLKVVPAPTGGHVH